MKLYMQRNHVFRLLNRVKYQITVRDRAKTSRPKHNVKLRQSTTLQNMNYKSEGSINMNYIQG